MERGVEKYLSDRMRLTAVDIGRLLGRYSTLR